MELMCVLGAQVLHRVDAEAADDGEVPLHPRDFEQRALVGELEQPVGADASPPGQSLAINSQRGAMQELVRVLDSARSQPSNIVVGDPAQVLERPIHMTSMRGNPGFPLSVTLSDCPEGWLSFPLPKWP